MSIIDSMNRPTITDVARKCGLSKTTVSVILNESPASLRVPQETRQRVRSAASELGYRPSWRARALTSAYREAGGPATVNRRGHFSMLIAQLGHITEIAATDWLKPNPRSPERADSAAWIGEVLEEPHTRQLLETILEAL